MVQPEQTCLLLLLLLLLVMLGEGGGRGGRVVGGVRNEVRVKEEVEGGVEGWWRNERH